MAQATLVGELEVNVEIKAPAKKYYQMWAVKPEDLVKAARNIQRCETQGDYGKVGSIIVWNYVLDGHPQTMTDRIEAVNPEKNLIVFRVVDGDPMKVFKSFLVTIQVTPKQTGSGNVVNCHIKYEKINEKVAPPENLLAVFVKVSKDMDQMLVS